MSVTCYANPNCVPPVLGPGVHSAPPQIVHTAQNLVPAIHMATGGLAFTGADVAELFIYGSGAVLAGLLMMAGRSGRKAGPIQ